MDTYCHPCPALSCSSPSHHFSWKEPQEVNMGIWGCIFPTPLWDNWQRMGLCLTIWLNRELNFSIQHCFCIILNFYTTNLLKNCNVTLPHRPSNSMKFIMLRGQGWVTQVHSVKIFMNLEELIQVSYNSKQRKKIFLWFFSLTCRKKLFHLQKLAN